MKNKNRRTFVKTRLRYGLTAVAVTAFIGAVIWFSFAGQTNRRVSAAPLPPPNGTVVAWGAGFTATGVDPEYGQSIIPAGLNNVKAIAAGAVHSLAVKSDGTVVAWGANDYGQTTVPIGLSGVTSVAAGWWHSLALKSDGTVVAWGPTSGICFPNCGQAVVPAGLSGVTAISAGANHNLALKNDGTVEAWGYNVYGEGAVPAGLGGVTAISAGWYHNLALKNDGTVVAWGWNEFGQVNGTPSTPYTGTADPVVLDGQTLTNVVAVAAGFRFSVALKGDGTVVVWGGEGGAQTSVPSGATNVTAIAVNAYDIQALKSDGTVVAWGGNANGAAVVPAGLTGVNAIAGGAWHTLGLIAATDTTAPTLNPVVSPNPVLLNGSATVTSGAADEAGGSGLASESCGTLDTSTVGIKTVTCTATDNAGNTASADAQYSVVYNFAGFFQPVDNSPILNVVTAGSAVPLKFSLGGYQGMSIFAAGYPASSPIGCNETEAGNVIEETVNAGGSSLSYDAAADRYSYVWKTNKAWKGNCRMLVVKLADGSNHLAKFRFK